MRARAPVSRAAVFRQGDAMALPYADASFDIAVMALVIHFVPDPAKGVAEMARVVRPGGWVTAYVWDDEAGGSPTQPLQTAIVLEGGADVKPPSTGASHMDRLLGLWTGAGLRDVDSRVIRVQRTFDDFESFWSANSGSGRPKVSLASLGPEATERVRHACARHCRPTRLGASPTRHRRTPSGDGCLADPSGKDARSWRDAPSIARKQSLFKTLCPPPTLSSRVS